MSHIHYIPSGDSEGQKYKSASYLAAYRCGLYLYSLNLLASGFDPEKSEHLNESAGVDADALKHIIQNCGALGAHLSWEIIEHVEKLEEARFKLLERAVRTEEEHNSDERQTLASIADVLNSLDENAPPFRQFDALLDVRTLLDRHLLNSEAKKGGEV